MKKINVTNKMSRTLNQFRRSKMKRMLLRKFAIYPQDCYHARYTQCKACGRVNQYSISG